MAENSSYSLSLPWTRWLSVPFALFSIAMGAGFWGARGRPLWWFWSALAVLMGYAALSMLLNRTVIRLDAEFLVVNHRPLPWPGKRVARGKIKAVTVLASTSKDHSQTTTWGLSAVLRDGRALKLSWGPIAGHRYNLLAEAADSLNRRLAL